MKKKVTAIIIIIVLAGLTGCVQTTELDKEQELQFIEYSVYSVLEHDKNYMIGLNQVEIGYEPETESDAADNQQQTVRDSQIRIMAVRQYRLRII